jgi:hypothetical protein
VFLNCSIIVNTQIKCIYIPHVQKNPTPTGENDKVQQKITSFKTAKGGSRVDNQDPILKELTTLGTMVLEINTKMNSMITKEEFQNKLYLLP